MQCYNIKGSGFLHQTRKEGTSMGKRFWMSAFFACGLSLAAFAAPQDKATFDATIKHVDMGGEMLQYQNTRGMQEFFAKIPAAVRIFTAGQEYAATVDCAVESVLKLINIQAYKAYAASSAEAYPGIYNFKTFALLDMQAKSLFIDPNAPNKPLDWQSLPADTRFAVKQYINLGRVWNMVYNEAKNNKDPQIRQLADMVVAARQNGIDIHALFASFDGDIEILLTGTSLEDAAAKVVIPDKNGSISALLKMLVPPQGDSNVGVIPTPVANIKVIYEQGKITAVSNDKLLTRPTQTLGNKAEYEQYARLLPHSGNGYCVIDISADIINLGKTAAADEEQLVALIDLLFRPISAVGVSRTEKDGYSTNFAGNISIAQLIQIISSGAGVLPTAAGILVPALNSAQDRAKQATCVNNLKQLGLAVMMSADEHDGLAPADINAMVKAGYITEDVCSDLIYLGKNLKLSLVKNPSGYPIAICDRCSHESNQVHILFADGHVIGMPVAEDSSEEDILQMIANMNNLQQAELDALQKQLGE